MIVEPSKYYVLHSQPRVQAYQVMTGLSQPMWFHTALCQKRIKLHKKRRVASFVDMYNGGEGEIAYGDVLVYDENEYFVPYTLAEFTEHFRLFTTELSPNSARLSIAGQRNPTARDADALGRVLVFDARSGVMVFRKLDRLEFGDAWLPAAITLDEVTEARREALKVR